jgi:hypothetical protein
VVRRNWRCQGSTPLNDNAGAGFLAARLAGTPTPEEKVPDGLDWDLWLGGAAMRPYRSQLVPFNWRGYFDFGAGPLGDWGVHAMGPLNMALQLALPTSVEVLRQEGKSRWTYPNRSLLRYEFPARGNMPAVSIYWHDAATNDNPWLYRPPGMEKEAILPAADNLAALGRPSIYSDAKAIPPAGGPPPIPAALAPRLAPQPGVLCGNGAVFVGDKGFMATTREGVHLLPEERWKSYRLPPMLLTRSPGHYQDWIRACKGGEAACSNFAVSALFAEWLTLGTIAYRIEGKLEYDAATHCFTNRPEADVYLNPVYRKGWEPVL